MWPADGEKPIGMDVESHLNAQDIYADFGPRNSSSLNL